MTEQQLQARKNRNIQRYWNFIRHVLKNSPAATNNFKAQKRVISGVFYDVHHIIPLELGGTNAPWNLVLLTKKQHLFAHNILNRIFDRPKEVIKRLDYVANINDMYLMKTHSKVSILKWLNTVKNRELAETCTKFCTGRLDRKTALIVLNEFVKRGMFAEFHKAKPEEKKKK